MKPHFFNSPSEFRAWLDQNHSTQTEIWVGFWKKISGKKGMNYSEALDEALCYGWIDGLVNKNDENSYAQRFSPRRAKSLWSKINTQNIERLIEEGRMMPAGLAAVNAAKEDGRWEKAYESPTNMTMPEDFLTLLKKNKKANDFFKTLNKTNIFYIAFQLQTAKKEETRQRRINKFIKMLEREEKIY